MKLVRCLLLAFGVALLVSPRIVAADKPYTEGSVWDVTFVRTKYGHDDDYLKSLHHNYKTLMDAAIKQGLVVSYKILNSQPTDKNDWDVMLLVEYKNMAALDGLSDKMDALAEKVVGSEDEQNKVRDKRADIREILGTKLCRELNFK